MTKVEEDNSVGKIYKAADALLFNIREEHFG